MKECPACERRHLDSEPCVNIEDLEARIIQLEEENAQLKSPLSSSPTIEDFFFWLQKEVHKNGLEKGWWTRSLIPEPTHPKPLEVHALIHSEIAEATEEVRKDSKPIYEGNGKPEGEAIELADAVIIIMSYFESKGWNLGQAIHLKHQHNKIRPHREGYRKY